VRDRPAHLVSYFLLSTVGIREAESLPLLKTNKQAKKKKNFSRAPAAHACNPSYSGGRDQEDCGLKPALGKQFERPYLKKKHLYKKRLVEWLKA
jgi:hypothetical protein